MEWSWSGVLEWHVGVKFWSGMYSEFEFFVVHHFFIILTVNIDKANEMGSLRIHQDIMSV